MAPRRKKKLLRPFRDHNEIAASIIETYADRLTEKGIDLSRYRRGNNEYRDQKAKLDSAKLQYQALKATFEQDDSARFEHSRQIIRIAQAIFYDDPVMLGVLAQFRRKEHHRKAEQPPANHAATVLPEAITAVPGSSLPVARA